MKETILDRDRLSVLSGALILGLALGRFLETPVRPVAVNVLGSPLGINLSATTILLLVTVGLGATAVESLVRSHPLARRGQLGRSVIYWITPALLVLGLAGWLLAFEGIGTWTAGVLACAILIPPALAVEYANVDAESRARPLVRWAERAFIYLVAFLLFSRIYDLRVRALLGSPAVFGLSALLVARYLYFEIGSMRQSALYGASAGLLLGLFNWAVNYWSLAAMQGGLLMLVVFYVLLGLIQGSLSGRFGRQLLLEYGFVLLAGLVIVLVMGLV